jgi:hypothetical protein
MVLVKQLTTFSSTLSFCLNLHGAYLETLLNGIGFLIQIADFWEVWLENKIKPTNNLGIFCFASLTW